MSKWRKIWDEGFEAGRFYGSQCPYRQGTKEARMWEQGWSFRVLERSGLAHLHECAPPESWREKLERIIGFRTKRKDPLGSAASWAEASMKNRLLEDPGGGKEDG